MLEMTAAPYMSVLSNEMLEHTEHAKNPALAEGDERCEDER